MQRWLMRLVLACLSFGACVGDNESEFGEVNGRFDGTLCFSNP